jgi:fused signal recognition particle receptor
MIFNFKKKSAEPEAAPTEKQSLFSRFKQGLSKTRHQLTDNLASLLLGAKNIDENLLEEIETQLLLADVGIDATETIISDLTARLRRHELNDGEAVFTALSEDLKKLLDVPAAAESSAKPKLILMVGINGAGKTTTIGKLAKHLQAQGKSVLLAAGDTFRAAAIEQLQVWGERNDVPVIAQAHGADSAAVVFDALQAGIARDVDVVIADTAGRLHTQSHLMEELKKVTRVVKKLDPQAPHEVILVLDATIGQNALQQAKEFKQAVDINSLILTKLDGTAKGGVVFALTKQQGIPIRYIGVGEKIDDLKPFDADTFVQALLQHDKG